MATRSRGRLEEYRARRNFDVTPEPAPGRLEKAAAETAPFFMVHKHDASRLHYDLRLEMDGALASWAIPKGPSYDPTVKRFAVQTEDHPLEYGNFEGRIPEGEYGAGDSIIWDRGTFDTVPPGQASAMRKKGHLHLELRGQKLKGHWHLVRTRTDASGKPGWLLFKAKDGLENPAYDIVTERPESVQTGRRITRGPVRKKDMRSPHPDPRQLLDKVWPPMLATLSTASAGSPEKHVFEVKYDGYRGLAAVSGGRIAFLSRNAIDLGTRFPGLYRALSRLPIPEVVLDGEAVALDSRGVSRFELLMDAKAEHRFVAFDILWLDGEDLRARPLEERRDLLESVLANVPRPIEIADRLEGSVDAVLKEAKGRGLEGILAKERGSPYVAGRAREWLKIKVDHTQEVAIIGFTPISTGRKEIGALLVAVHDGKAFRFAGKVGTGYTAKLRQQLHATLQKDVVDKSAAVDAPRMRDAVWLTPRYVAQVRFTEWTKDGKLRHPSFQGLREDKKPEEARREVPVEVTEAPRASPKRAKSRAASESEKVDSARTDAPEVKLTSGDRIVFPEAKITKGEVFAHYRHVAEVMVRVLAGRPLALKQWPKGIGGEGFYRQNVPTLPAWASSVEVETGRRPVRHPIVDRPETLLWLANQSAFELHMWHSRVPHLSEPDWVAFDLDPGSGAFADLITVAQALHALLEKLGLESVPKTSGKRGLHVFVPIARGHTYQDTLGFAVAITAALAQALGNIATTERTISKRGGRLYLDAFQNGQGKTIIAPYSLRGVEGAPLSTPLRWDEVTPSLDPSRFTLRTMRKRLDEVGDLFAPALKGRQRLPRFTR